MPDRYCRNCGNELRETDRFCSNCAAPVQEAAHVPTPEADVPVPPPPEQTGATELPTQQARAAPSRRSATAGRLFVGGIVVLFGLFALFVITSIVGGGGGGEAGKSGGSDGSDTPEEKEQPPISCKVRAPCDLGESTVTVMSAKKTDLITTNMDNFEGNFMLVEFDYTYGGTQPATVQDYNWKLEDGMGRTYRYAFDPTSTYEIDQERSLLYEKINPGTRNPGAIIFEVAPDAQNFTLYIKDLIRPQTSKQAEVDL